MATDARLPDPDDAGTGGGSETWSRARMRRVAARVVLSVTVLLTVLGVSIVVACFINDRTINEARGQSIAEVVDPGPIRTIIRFSTSDGRVFIPPNGALYHAGLQEGQTIQVEFDKRNPDLVRVAGRGAQLSLLPVGSSLAVVWAVLGPTYLLLRRSRRAEDE